MSTVAKWGNSLAIRIPKHISDRIELKEGMTISIDIDENNKYSYHSRKNYVHS